LLLGYIHCSLNGQHVKLTSFEMMQCFLAYVPRSYYRYIQQLDVCTEMSQPMPAGSPHPRTDAVVSLLNDCTRLDTLSLQLSGSLANHVIPCFARLEHLRELSISHWGLESMYVPYNPTNDQSLMPQSQKRKIGGLDRCLCLGSRTVDLGMYFSVHHACT
jgi:hypothetical protein